MQSEWPGLLQILVVVLGQELPEETADTAQQVFGLVVAAIGLAAFALVLALVEQVVLQVRWLHGPFLDVSSHSAGRGACPSIMHVECGLR